MQFDQSPGAASATLGMVTLVLGMAGTSLDVDSRHLTRVARALQSALPAVLGGVEPVQRLKARLNALASE